MIKQREANSWKSVSYAKSITGAQTYTKFPIVLRTTEQSIPTWSVKGNTTTSGTPTPSNPMSVNGVGDKTANLYNYQAVAIGKYIDANGVEQTSGSTGHQILNHTASISVIAGSTYTFKIQKEVGYSALSNAFCWFDSNNQLLYRDLRGEIGSGEEYIEMSYTAPSNAAYLIINFRDTYYDTGMLNTGSTALDYEPYGYKIPISSGGVTTPIYLTKPLMKIDDTVDSLASSGTVTYNIRKIVITGEETGWSQDGTSGSNNRYRLYLTNVKNTGTYITDFYNSHFKVQVGYAAYTSVIWYGGSQYVYMSVPSSEYPTFADFKTWLQQQYAAGTPVTVWYQLATPTTETVTAPSIPTTSSPATIDVNTSVKPSEMSLTYDGYKICKPTKIVIPEPSEWIAKSWNGYNGMVGSSIWSDGDNIYYSMAMYQYVLNKSTSTWSAKTWNGLTSFNGAHIWTDGDNVYYSFGDDQYVLNRQTSTWSAKTWNGLASFDGGYVWTDGNNVYYSRSSNQYILDKATSTWVEKEWNGLTSFDGSSVWFEGNNIYYSYGLTRYVLNKSTSTWSEKVWTSAPYNMDGSKIWSVNGYTFYSNGTYEQYVLDKSTSTWSTKTWTGFTSFRGRNIWTDGTNIYVSDGNGKQYVLVR